MTAEVIPLRPFQSVRDQAQRLGTNVTMAIVRKVRDEQRAGRNGNAVAGQLQQKRMFRNGSPDDPVAA